MTNENPYQTPQSELEQENLPQAFLGGNISEKELLYAAWLSIFSAVLVIPLIGLSFISSIDPDPEFVISTKVLDVISAALSVYLILMTKRFLIARFSISGINTYVNLIVLLTIVMTVLSLFMEYGDTSEEMDEASITYYTLLVPLGILTFLFGLRIVKVKEDYPLLKLYAWLVMLTGLFVASLIFLLLAIPLVILVEILRALIFFYARRELLTHQQQHPNRYF